MKKANPNRYLDDFGLQVREGLRQFGDLESTLTGAIARAALLKAVAEDTAFRLGTLWEVFQGRWHVCVIAREPEVFVGELRKLLERQVKDDVRTTIAALHPDAFTVPSHPNLQQIETILDPNRYNLAFKDAEAWMNSSAQYHSDKYKALVRKVVADPESSSLLDFLKKLRNLLAHGSHGSKASFNRACKSRPPNTKEGLVGQLNDPLLRGQRAVRDIGAYLRARTGSYGERRIEILHNRVLDVAEKLRLT